MGGGKVVATVVLILVILVAIVLIAKQQSKTIRIPDEVLARKIELITSTQPYTVKTVTYKEIQDVPIDPATGYRRIEGKLWASKTMCANCNQAIPSQPMRQDAPEEGPEPDADYTCPLCKKSAFEPQEVAEPPAAPQPEPAKN
jgi:hypothetical protein